MGTPNVQRIELSEVDDQAAAVEGKPVVDRDYSLIRDVNVQMSVVVGHAKLSVHELFNLKTGAVLKLLEDVNEPVTFYLDGKAVARGELVAVDDCFGVRISEVL